MLAFIIKEHAVFYLCHMITLRQSADFTISTISFQNVASQASYRQSHMYLTEKMFNSEHYFQILKT